MNEGLYIDWEQSISKDFYSYKLEKSLDSFLVNSEILKETIILSDTLFIDHGLNRLLNQYYRVTTIDTFSYQSESEIITFEKDASPNSVEIYSIDYDTTQLVVRWSKSKETDFMGYTLFISETQSSQKEIVQKYTNILDTTFSSMDFNPNYLKWYWIEVEDSLGQKSLSNPFSTSINSPPNRTIISSVEYDLDRMSIQWDSSIETDFASYEILYSTTEFIDYNIISIIDQQNVSFFNLSEFDPTIKNWFKVRVNDFWQLNSISDPVSNSIDLNPEPVHIQSIEYTLDEMTIHWTQSNENDFSSYEIFKYDEGLEEYSLIALINDQETSFLIINEFDPTIENWYKIKSTDHWGLSSFGNEMSNSLDPFPNSSFLNPILYQEGQFFFNWSRNNEIDFNSYTLYKSNTVEFVDSSIIYTTLNESDTSFQYELTSGLLNYYRIAVKDKWGQVTVGIPTLGNSYSMFSFTYGGQEVDYGKSVIQSNDHSFLICGTTSSEGNGSTDVVVLKTDSLGAEDWFITYGGINSDYGNEIIESSSGGFLFVGNTQSFGSGLSNLLVSKIDESGNQEWLKTYGGTDTEQGNSLYQINNGNYVIVGSTKSYGEGQKDIWILIIDNEGNEIWNQAYGTNVNNYGVSVLPSYDGGLFILANNEKVDEENIYDISILKINSDWNVEWEQFFGGDNNDLGYSFIDDGDGLVICGTTTSFGNGLSDAYVIKLDYSGNIIWEETYGESLIDYASCIVKTLDNGYAMVGTKESNSGLEGFNIWLFKINNSGTLEWSRLLGDNSSEQGYSLANASDGGFILTGIWDEDIFLIKTDSEGNIN